MQVQLLGTLALQHNGMLLPLPASSDARHLLAYLLVQRRPQARLTLLGQLRPELAEDDARRALRQALWQIKRVLPDLLSADAEQVWLTDPDSLHIDSVEFESLVRPYLARGGTWTAAAQDLSRAIALYQNDLLEGYYDDWVILERERLRELYLQALECLTQALKATLRYEQALQIALRLAGADPLRESAHREIMRLHHYLGNPAAALRQYETCRQVLQRELGLDPDPETRQLAQAIAQNNDEDAPTVPYLPAPGAVLTAGLRGNANGIALPLIGRSAERAQLLQWLQPNPAEQGCLIVVEGEAGVGKTRLLREVARDFEWHGGQVLWGKFSPLETGWSLNALRAALESGLTPLRVEQLQRLLEPVWLQVVQPLLPALCATTADPLPALDSKAARARLVEGLARLLQAWAAVNSVLLILEDFQWADPDTAALILHLTSSLESPAVTLLVSLRTEEAAEPAFPWNCLRGRLTVDNLMSPAVHELVQACLGGSVTPLFEARLMQETHGNPLFVLETLFSLYDEGVLRQNSEGQWVTPYDLALEEGELPLPPAVEQVILRRLEQLPSELRALLEQLAVLGGQFDFRLLADLQLVPLPALLTALQELLRRRLLLELPHVYQFRHDKIRQVVYEALTVARRRELHGRLAQALAQVRPEQCEALAYHFTQAEQWEAAYHYQQQAATETENVFAYTRALEHLNMALHAAEQRSLGVEARFALLQRREALLEILGRVEEQGRDLAQLVTWAKGEPRRLCQVLQRQAYWWEALNRFTEAENAARQALTLADTLNDDAIRIAAYVTLGDVLYTSYSGRWQEVRACFQVAGELCRRLSDTRLAADLHAHLALIANQPGEEATALDETLQALALYEELGDQAAQAFYYCNLGSIRQLQEGGSAAAERAYQKALELARSIGYRLVEARALNNLGNIYVEMEVERALACYIEAAAILRGLRDERRVHVVQLNIAQCLLGALGDYETARPLAEKALAYARCTDDAWVWGFAEIIAGWVAGYTQDLPTARTLLLAAVARLEAIKTPWLIGVAYQILALIEEQMGWRSAAQEHLTAAEKMTRQEGWQPSLVIIQAHQARMCLEAGELTEADRLSTEALHSWNATGAQPWLAPFVRSQVLLALGRTVEADPLLEQAHILLTQMLEALTPVHRQLSVQRVAIHRDILAAWQTQRRHCVTVRLPRNDAPTGRPLQPEEYVEVQWTITAPADEAIPDKVNRRRQRLARLLNEAASQGARPTYSSLAQALAVSVRTIAQDLAAIGHPASLKIAS